MSDYALDLLARRRAAGENLESGTVAILNRLRPSGPIRKSP
ncbi:MAG: hypothetical protein OXD46_03860 [Chloroflexi bacterium]|nr:hypothetical protein [Chloroflexota bacterium]